MASLAAIGGGVATGSGRGADAVAWRLITAGVGRSGQMRGQQRARRLSGRRAGPAPPLPSTRQRAPRRRQLVRAIVAIQRAAHIVRTGCSSDQAVCACWPRRGVTVHLSHRSARLRLEGVNMMVISAAGGSASVTTARPANGGTGPVSKSPVPQRAAGRAANIGAGQAPVLTGVASPGRSGADHRAGKMDASRASLVVCRPGGWRWPAPAGRAPWLAHQIMAI